MPRQKTQNDPETKRITTADWRCSLCDLSFPLASCSEVEFNDIFNPSDSCYDKTPHTHDLNLLFSNTTNSDNTSINDTDNEIISEEDDPFTINSNTINTIKYNKYN